MPLHHRFVSQVTKVTLAALVLLTTASSASSLSRPSPLRSRLAQHKPSCPHHGRPTAAVVDSVAGPPGQLRCAATYATTTTKKKVGGVNNRPELFLRGGGPPPSLGLSSLFAGLINAVEGMGPAAPAGFAAAYIGCEMLGIPPGALVVFAGAFFGPVVGTALALANGVASAAACFFIGQKFREKFMEWLKSREAAYRQFDFINRVISKGGFRALLLLRLIPTPIPGMNYFYGVTTVNFPSYITATALGYLPGTAVLAYSGAGGKALFTGGFKAADLFRQPRYVYVVAVVVGALLFKAISDVAKGIMIELNEIGDSSG